MNGPARVSPRGRMCFALFAIVGLIGVTGTPASAADPDLSSAWDSSQLNVVGVVPLPGTPLTGDIVFFFDGRIDEAMAKSGAASVPFTAEPNLPGKFHIGPSFIRLERPAVPNNAAAGQRPPAVPQVFRVKLNESIASADGRRINPKQIDWVFAPFVFKVEQIWVVEEKPGETVLGIRFPEPPNPRSAGMLFPGAPSAQPAEGHIKVQQQSDGAAVPFDVRRGQEPNTILVTIHTLKPVPLRLVVTKGLKDIYGILETAEDSEFLYSRENALKVNKVQWGDYKKDEQTIAFEFSDVVKLADLKTHLAIKNAADNTDLPFEVRGEGDSPAAVVAIHLPQPAGARVAVRISPGMPGGNDTTLKQPYATELKRVVAPLQAETQLSQWEEGLALTVKLSRPVALKDLESHLEIQPQVGNMRVESLNISEFRVFGDWMSKQDYQVRITAGLVDQEGWELAQPVVRAFQAPQVAPLLRFNYAGRFYVPRQAGSVLAIESRNQSKVKAQIWRMFPSNIAVALRDMRDGEPGYQFNDRWAEKIDEKELTLESKGDAMATTPLDLATLLPSGRSGVFLLVVKSEDPEFEYLSASKLVLTTNIGALAQWRDEELALFTHDLFSLAPLAKAKVTVYSKKNQTCDEGVTDGQGLIHMTGFDVNKGEPKVAVIEAGDDYTFLELERRGEEDLGEAVWKLDPYDTKSYEAFLYADRELYRPGETAHLHWIVRRNHTETPSEVPLLVEILKPHGGTLLSQPTVLSKLGDGGLDLATQREYPTGRYRVRLLVPGNQKPLGEYLFFLEDFVPNRMKATVKIDNERPTLGETVGLTIHADHLFGAPAAGQRAEAEVVLDRGEFKPEKWADYHFGNDSQFEAQRIQCGEGQTDEKGDVTLHCELQAAKATFPLQASILGRVFELGGRAVTAKTDATVFPTTASLGLAAQAKPSGEVEVSVAAITPEEAPAALSAVTVTLERQTWNYYVRRYYNSNEANWSESFQEVESKEVPLVEGKGSASFAMHDYGYYRIRVHSDKTPQYSTLSFYSYGGRPQIVAEARPSLIKITLDKKEYQVGDEATARIESPFDGMGVVVLQGEAIQQVFPIDIKDGVAEATFLVGREQFPNGWVEVTVIHALEKDRAKVYPFSSFALANLRVVDREKQLTVTYPSFPQEIRPSQKFDVAIEVKDSKGQPAEAGLTLAAVDEGIHLMTGYESPDPFEWISRSRRPDLRRAQYYDKIAYLFDKPAPGGDGEEEAAKRINPPGENWIRNVALWVQDIHTDAQGKATVSLDVPEFTGQLRFVAVAFNDKALGARSDDLYVRRPYMMRASLPRFLSPADKFESRVVLYNQADRPVSAQLKWTSSGALEPEEGGKSLDVPAKGQADLRVNFAAGATTGQGEIRFQGAFRDASGKALETLVETDPIPVRPAAAYEARNELAILKPGESRTFDKGAFIDDARFEIELTAGASPLLRLQKALEYVVGYPYGCIEQTTSRLMPMYLLRKNRDLMDLTLKGGESIDNYIQSGISRLFSMQTPEGGLAFWPGAPEPYPYGSIYALHFLTLVKNGREYPLPEQSFKWLQEYVKQAGTRAPDNSPSSLYQRAYAAYVLALGGDADALRSIASFDNIELPAAARFMLAAALAQNTGDVARAKLFLTQTPTTPFEVREPDRTLNSDIRNDAVQLLAMLKLGEDKQAIADKANRLVSFLQNQSHGTTHETAFVVAALCEYLSSLNEDITKASATINASDDQPKEIQGAAMYSGIVKGAAASFAIANTGQADLYVNVTRRGIPTEPQAAASAGVAVARTVLTSGGGPVNGTTYKHADGYIVDLALKCDSEARNLIVSDLLPAGFEVENPRLDESVLKGVSLPAPATPSYVDVRDDRVIFAFAQLPAGLSHTYYVVRAVTPGQFQYPPAQAECMYDPSIHGSSEASEATVK